MREVLLRESIDRSIVAEGFPTEPGMHLFWSDQCGWPVIDLVRVDVDARLVTYWKGTGGTDRPSEVLSMLRVPYDSFIGHSRVSAEALAYHESRWQRTSEAIHAMLSESSG